MSYPPISDYPTEHIPPLAAVPPDEPDELPPRRRRLRVALLAALAVLTLAMPVALFVLLRGDARTPSSTASPPAAAPSATVTGPSPAVSSAPAARAPDGRIPLEQLKNATLDIPAWPADNLTGPSGKLKFAGGETIAPPDAAFPFERHIIIFGVAYGDLDHDGAQETVATIGCVVQGGSMQLIAFDRSASGAIVTMDRVVATTGEIRVFETDTVRVRSDGSVSVRVGDYQQCCGDETPVLWQVRTYGWTGHDFRQDGGPTAFPVNPSVTETGLTAGELVLGPALNGVRHGTLTVTVTYLRGAKPDHLVLDFYPPAGLQREGDWPPVRPGDGSRFSVDLPTSAAGVSVTYTFAFSRPSTDTGGEFGIQLGGVNAKNVWLGESNPFNNGPAVTVRTTN